MTEKTRLARAYRTLALVEDDIEEAIVKLLKLRKMLFKTNPGYTDIAKKLEEIEEILRR